MNETLPGAAYDNKIYTKYSKNTIEKKQQNKAKFCEEYELLCDRRQMLLGITQELTAKNGAQLFEDLLPGIATLDICLAVRGVGSEKYQGVIDEYAKAYPGRLAVVPDTNEDFRKMLASVDACFFFSAGEDNEKLAMGALAYAALPIAPDSMKHLVEDYNPNQETGHGFLYQRGNLWAAFAAIVRARESFRFPYDWKTIQKSAIDA
jgi:starch synthase